MKVEKRYNDVGQVAVLYTPKSTVGWSTRGGLLQSHIKEELMYDSAVVDLVLANKRDEILNLDLDTRYGAHHVCKVGAPSLQVAWVNPGEPFAVVRAGTGDEMVVTIKDLTWQA